MSIPLMDNHTEKKARKIREVPLWVIKLVLWLGALLFVVPILAMLGSTLVTALLVFASDYTLGYGQVWPVVALILLGAGYIALAAITVGYYRGRRLARHRRQTWRPR